MPNQISSNNNISGICQQIINTQSLRDEFIYNQINKPADGLIYESAIRELSENKQIRNDQKLAISTRWYRDAHKQVPSFHLLHGDLFNFYITRWNNQVLVADTLQKLNTSTHAVTLKFRYNYTRRECIAGGSRFFRELGTELEGAGCKLEAGFAVAEPDRIPALRDESIHFHAGLNLGYGIKKRELDKYIQKAIDQMDSDKMSPHIGSTFTSELASVEAIRGWELYASKSAQDLGLSMLSNVFEVTSDGLLSL